MTFPITFEPLDLHDGKGRIQLLLHHKSPIQCWNKNKNASLYPTAVHIEHRGSESLIITMEEDQAVDDGDYFATFQLNSFLYYFSFNFSEGKSALIKSPIFRAQKRKDERILLYPAYNAFLYLEPSDKEDFKNVLPLRKSSDFAMPIKQTLAMQLRINDISISALSVRLPQSQVSLASRDWNGDFKISIDGKPFMINSLKFLYHVPLLEKKHENGHLNEKAGFTFERSDQALIDFINEKKTVTKNNEEHDKYFEEFLNKT